MRSHEDRPGARPRWALGFEHQFTLIRVEDDRPYLTRWWLLATPWFGVAVHKMLAGDVRSALHDHPMPFASLVLRGGYIEQRLDPLTGFVGEHVVRRRNVMRRFDAHWIERLLRTPTWTLLLMGAQRRRWGFLEPEGGLRSWNHVPDGQGGTMRDGRWTAAGRMWTWTDHAEYNAGHVRSEEKP